MILINGKEVEFKKFPNGETLMVEESIQDDVFRLSFKYSTDDDLIKLMLVKNYLDTNKIDVPELVIYYMPYSRMDRSQDGSAFTLKYVASFINSLKFQNVKVIEPHSDVTNALIDNVEPIYVNDTLLPMVMGEVDFLQSDVLFFPDAGAAKRYSHMKFPHLVGHKHRDFKTGNIESLQVVGKVPSQPFNVIIVDDLSSRGGTFMFSAKELKKLGADKIYLLVAHAEDTIFDGDIFKTDYIEKVFTTNTIMTKNGKWDNKQYDSKLEVYEIEGVLK